MIILGISGSIAAYKSIETAKLLIENGNEVAIVLTKSAEEFVSVLTLKSLFPGKVYLHNDHLGKNDEMLHITLAKAASIVLIAPCSANMIAKIAHGFSDCLLSNIILATQAKIMLAPAMNKIMWENIIVQKNLASLSHIDIIYPSSGLQACGDNGIGRMKEPSEILEYVKNNNIPKILANKKVLITSGATIEKIDPVRYLSNFSSGKMGHAIAKMAFLMGANVTLVSGNTSIASFPGIAEERAITADEMLSKCMSLAAKHDIFISAAAIADYKPKNFLQEKIKKTSDISEIKLIKNPDIISSVKKSFPNLFTVGFAAETNNFIEYGKSKLLSKNLDMIAINDVSEGKIFGEDDNELHVIDKKGNTTILQKNKKEIIACELLKIIAENLG